MVSRAASNIEDSNYSVRNLASLMKSSQSRIAKMENGDPSVSLDLIIKTLLALGVERDELAECFLSPEKG